MDRSICYLNPETNKFTVLEINKTDEGNKPVIAAESEQLFYALKKYLCTFDEKTVFRGQNKDWNPVASIFRSEFSNLSKNEQEYYKNIKRDHEIELGNYKNEYELWSKMQHFGYPTRLLDVTTNRFKAIAFMIDGINKMQIEDKPPCVYIFEPLSCESEGKVYINEEKGKVDCEAGKYPLIVPPNNQQANIRLHAQSGQFIFFDNNCETEGEYLEELEKKFKVTKLEVKLNSTVNIADLENKLDEYGYGLDTLYPDMIKRSEYYKTKWKK